MLIKSWEYVLSKVFMLLKIVPSQNSQLPSHPKGHGKTQNLSSQRGFTVIEVLIGIGLFAVIMPSIILAIVGISRLNDRAADLVRANIVAEQKFEELRSAGYNSLADGETFFTGELDPTFTLPRTAKYTVATPEAGVKTIEIEIQYTDRGATRDLGFKTQISELGVAQ